VLSYGQVTIGTTATLIVAADSEHVTEVTIPLNTALLGTDIYIGDSSVTTSTGCDLLKMSAAGAVQVHLPPGTSLYGIASVSGGTVEFFATA
jgi:hypothetical protein